MLALNPKVPHRRPDWNLEGAAHRAPGCEVPESGVAADAEQSDAYTDGALAELSRGTP